MAGGVLMVIERHRCEAFKVISSESSTELGMTDNNSPASLVLIE